MSSRYEIKISGTGGQGVVLAGIILAEAAGRWKSGQHVVQTVSYGPQVRGGMSSAEVVISKDEIDYPKPIKLDLLIPFTQDAANEGQGIMKPDGIIIQDPDLVQRAPEGWVAQLPLTKLAVESTGRVQMANMAALGAASVFCPALDAKSLEKALKERASEKFKDAFLKAAEAGRAAAEKIKEKITFEEAPSQDD